MNEPKFFSFRQPHHWRRGASSQLAIVREGVTIENAFVYRPNRRQSLSFPEVTPPIAGASPDGAGRWILMDGEGVVWRTDIASGHVEKIAETDRTRSGRPSRFAAIQDSIVVLLPEPESMLRSLSFENAQVRWTVSDWDGQPFFGSAIQSDGEGGFFVLGNLNGRGEVYLLRFDSSGEAAGSLPVLIGDGLDLSAESPERFQLSVAGPGQGWLLDKEANALYKFDFAAGSVAAARIPEEAGRLSAVCGAGTDQAWGLLGTDREPGTHSLLRFSSDGTILERGYAGSEGGDGLWTGPGCLYVLHAGQHEIRELRPVSETAVWEPLGRRLGVWLCDALDSGVEETEWHKLVMNSRQESDTQIVVRCYASDSRDVVIGTEKRDLDHYIADGTIPMEEKLAALAGLWTKPLADPEDALLFKQKGRYLWLYVELIGSESHAPVVRSLEVHFPRETYLTNLPPIFQRHEQSRDFLSRYLGIFQTIMGETDRRITHVTRLFDVGGADGRSLRWLLGWLGIEGEDDWTKAQLRQLLKHAHTLYSLRGTKSAMELLISIYTGEKPIILEYEQVKPLKENPELGEVAERLYAADPHVFNVLVKAEHADTETKRVALLQLIDSFKPAFASCKLIVLQPWVYMDLHSYLGMNTVLSEPTLLTLDGRSSMPHHTITIDLNQDNRMDQHTRLGLDSRLE